MGRMGAAAAPRSACCSPGVLRAWVCREASRPANHGLRAEQPLSMPPLIHWLMPAPRQGFFTPQHSVATGGPNVCMTGLDLHTNAN